MNTLTEQQKAQIVNPFRDPQMKLAFSELVTAHQKRSRVLFLPDGVQIGVWDRASKQTFPYAHWRAGKACAEWHRRCAYDYDTARGIKV